MRDRARHPLAEYERKRDFSVTREPRGRSRTASKRKLAFVVQQHAASRMHFDLRLELDDVMMSWAVPKGPSLDPGTKRLAVEVEPHPIDYNKFEGTIPAGEYGAGTVMLWDRGHYAYPDPDPDPHQRLRDGYAAGHLEFELHGKRLRGRWDLVRLRQDQSAKPNWLLIKHHDAFAAPGSDVTAKHRTSVASGRTMQAIAAGRTGRKPTPEARGRSAPSRRGRPVKMREAR